MNIEFCTIKNTDDKTIIITSDLTEYPWHIDKPIKPYVHYSRTVVSDVDNNCDIKEVYKDYIIEILADNKIRVKYNNFIDMFKLLSPYLSDDMKNEIQ